MKLNVMELLLPAAVTASTKSGAGAQTSSFLHQDAPIKSGGRGQLAPPAAASPPCAQAQKGPNFSYFVSLHIASSFDVTSAPISRQLGGISPPHTPIGLLHTVVNSRGPR